MSVLSQKIAIFAVANPQWVSRHIKEAFSHRSKLLKLRQLHNEIRKDGESTLSLACNITTNLDIRSKWTCYHLSYFKGVEALSN